MWLTHDCLRVYGGTLFSLLVEGGGGFPAHPHRDAEIFSYVLEGALEHQDSMGNGSIVGKGGVQYMSAELLLFEIQEGK